MLSANGLRWAIATPHTAATGAGESAFEAGGNAIDAALAAATTLAVVAPHACGIGGDLFALVQHADGDVVAVDSYGASAATIDLQGLRAKHGSQMPERGPLTITVPGALAGWETIHGRGAVLPWSEAFEAARRFAADGAPLASGLADRLAAMTPLLADDPGFADVFFRDGKPLSEGDMLVQPALAATLDALAAGGAEAIYRGPVGEAYVEGLRAAGSPIAVADLAAHSADVVPPLTGRYRGLDVRVSPPASQGFVLLEILAAIERLGIDPDPLGPDAGVLALLFRAASADRDRHLADPRSMRIHPSTLLDDGHIAAICDEVRGRDAVPTPRARLGPDTAGLVTADAEGWAVSLIQSLSWGFGSGILEPVTGIVAQNRGSGFSLDPTHPNAIAPGKRPAHTLMPVMVHEDGRLAAVSGTMGGPSHPQINAMSIVRAFDLSMDPGSTVAAPRWIVDGDHEGVVRAEAEVPDGALAAIAGTGLAVDRVEEQDGTVGHAQLLRLDAGGLMEAGADPRADGSASAS